jgi:hypothetical protein
MWRWKKSLRERIEKLNLKNVVSKWVYNHYGIEDKKMKKIILTLGVLSFATLMGCIYQPPPPPPAVIPPPSSADLAAENIFNSFITDPTTGQSRPVIVGVIRNVGESPSPGGRPVILIARTIVNGAPVTEQLASTVVPSLAPGATFQIIGNPPQSLNPTTQYILSVSPGDDNPANDTFVLTPPSPPRY